MRSTILSEALALINVKWRASLFHNRYCVIEFIMKMPFRFVAWTTWRSWALPLRINVGSWVEILELQVGPLGISFYHAPPSDWSDVRSSTCASEMENNGAQRDYRGLIASIGAGDGATAFSLVVGDPLEAPIVAAFNGSLDAARQVHDALVPEWEWILQRDGEHCLISPAQKSDDQRFEVNMSGGIGSSGNAARDWLLAIFIGASNQPVS